MKELLINFSQFCNIKITKLISLKGNMEKKSQNDLFQRADSGGEILSPEEYQKILHESNIRFV